MLILHGDHQTASRNHLLAQRQRPIQTGIIDLSARPLLTVKPAVDTVTLFGQTNSVFVEPFSPPAQYCQKAAVDYLKAALPQTSSSGN
jgi:hypothetical protein